MFPYVIWNDRQSGTAGDRAVQYDAQDRSDSWDRFSNVFYSSAGYDSH